MPSRITFQCQKLCPCDWTIPVVDSVPAMRTTVAVDRPNAAS